MDEIDFSFIFHWLRFREMNVWCARQTCVDCGSTSRRLSSSGMFLHPWDYNFFVNDILTVYVYCQCSPSFGSVVIAFHSCAPVAHSSYLLINKLQYLYCFISCSPFWRTHVVAICRIHRALSFIIIWNIFHLWFHLMWFDYVFGLLERELCQLLIASAFATAMRAQMCQWMKFLSTLEASRANTRFYAHKDVFI